MTMAHDHLLQANRHIAEAEGRIEKQRAVIERLEANGHDTASANELLNTMLRSLETMRRHRRTIESELTEAVAEAPFFQILGSAARHSIERAGGSRACEPLSGPLSFGKD
jgi:hypothetical protein